jgi:putative transposase
LRIKELAVTGYRRIHVLLQRERRQINHKRTRRICRELGLQLRNKTQKRKVNAKLRKDRVQATAPNECWSKHFLSYLLYDGRKIWVLATVGNFTRLSPALDARHSYKGSDVVDTLERIEGDDGRSQRIKIDNSVEFISKDLDLWAYQYGVVLDFSRPGKPTDNAFVESYNGRVRAECLMQTGSSAWPTHRLNVRHGGETIMTSDRTAPLVTNLQFSALLHQGRTLIINGGNLRPHVSRLRHM